MVFSGLYGWAAVCQRPLFTKHHQLHREQIKSAAPRSSSCLKCYGRTTYLEPLYQLQWLAVILVCFEDDICQLMYDHIQRALVFNRFGEIKLGKKKKKENLYQYMEDVRLTAQGTAITLGICFTHCLYFDMLSKSLTTDFSLNARKLYSDIYFSAVYT